MVVKILFAAVAALVLSLNAFPNYYANLKTPPEKIFSGQASWFDPWDINVYVAALNHGQSGNLLLQNAYTTAPHQAALYYPLYTLTGYFLPELNAFLLFHLLAGAVGLSLLVVVWRLSHIFLKSEKTSLFAALLISLGGGLGWMLFPVINSADLFMTGFTFTSHFQRGHEGLAVIFYLLAFVLFYLGIERRSIRLNILSLLCLILLLLFYPFYILNFAIVGGLYSFLIYLRQGKQFPLTYFFINLAAAGAAALIYVNYLSSGNAFGSVLTQNLPTPGLLEVLLGYGILLPFFIWHLKYGQSPGKLFLTLWFIVNLSIAYLPFGFARFYLRTLYFPLVLLSIPVIIKLFQSKGVFLKVLSVLTVVSILSSSGFILSKRLREISANNSWYYLSQEENQALKFLKAVQPGSVLASYRIGNLIPAVTSNSVYFGHLLQTPNSQEKIVKLYQFYSQKSSEEEAKEFLNIEGLDYIYWGTEEQGINGKLNLDFLRPVFKKGEVTIFQVF